MYFYRCNKLSLLLQKKNPHCGIFLSGTLVTQDIKVLLSSPRMLKTHELKIWKSTRKLFNHVNNHFFFSFSLSFLDPPLIRSLQKSSTVCPACPFVWCFVLQSQPYFYLKYFYQHEKIYKNLH